MIPKRSRWSRARLRGATGLAAAIVAAAVAAPPAAAQDFTWSGGAPTAPGYTGWSNGANWVGGAAPSGAVGTLTFPPLAVDTCEAYPPTQACWTSQNDVPGITAGGIVLEDTDYEITGDAIQIGAGGISEQPQNDAGFSPYLALPITLAAPQTWTLAGSGSGGGMIVAGDVSGSNEALTVDLSRGAVLELTGSTADVGPVSVTGSGALALYQSSLDGGGAGNAVSLSGGAGLSVTGPSSTGRLTTSGSSIDVANRLAVDGSVSLGGGSQLSLAIDQAGTTPGTDYSQLSASGPVDLGDTTLALSVPGPGGNCPTLHAGDVLTLVSTSDTLTGMFSGIPGGSTVSVFCGAASTLRIDYTAHAVTATVVTAGIPPAPTSIALRGLPAGAVVNEPVALFATVTATTRSPSGTVAFDGAGGAPIAGCGAVPITAGDGTATCRTAFPSTAGDAGDVSVTFRPADPAAFEASTDAGSVSVGRAATTTDLSLTPSDGGVTLTAVVTPFYRGLATPSGTVDFLEDGAPIGPCAGRPAVPAAGAATASCNLALAPGEQHVVTARYDGDGDFIASFSPSRTAAVPAASSGPTPAAEPASPAAAPKVAVHLRAALAGGARRISAILEAGGVHVTFTAPAAGDVRLDWYTRGHVLLARAHAHAPHAGAVRMTLRPTRAGRRLLRHAKRLEVVARARFAGAGTAPVTVTRTITLRR